MKINSFFNKKVLILGISSILMFIAIIQGCYILINKQNEFAISRKEFNCDFNLPDDEEVLSIAEGICNDKLTVFHTIESMNYSFEELDWNIKYTKSPGTFQLYLQSLNPVVYLTRAYELSQNNKYLDMAQKFIFTWNDYKNDENNVKSNSMIWNDHGTALRAENIIYYTLVASEARYLKNSDKDIIVELLNSHAVFLKNDLNYTENHNHGIFQDRALMYIAYFLDNEYKDEWIEIVKKRLNEQMQFAFNDEMVHVENSPGYQMGVIDLYRIISDFLIQFNDEYGKELYDQIIESTNFMAYIVKPNGRAAAIGDTNDIINADEITSSNLEKYNNPYLAYSFSQGDIGEKPTETS